MGDTMSKGSKAGQHVKPPSDLTPEVLQKVARHFGGDALVRGHELDPEEPSWHVHREGKCYRCIYSDGELLLAVLNKAAEMGLCTGLEFDEGTWACWVADNSGYDTAPLEAALLAFSQLEPSNV
jgi:hypothetical protein